jgi:hypothetical protein
MFLIKSHKVDGIVFLVHGKWFSHFMNSDSILRRYIKMDIIDVAGLLSPCLPFYAVDCLTANSISSNLFYKCQNERNKAYFVGLQHYTESFFANFTYIMRQCVYIYRRLPIQGSHNPISCGYCIYSSTPFLVLTLHI